MREQPVEPCPNEHHHIGLGQDVGARCCCRQCVGVFQQTLGHGHGQVRYTRCFHQSAKGRIGLGIGGTFAQNDQGSLGIFEQVQRPVYRIGTRNLFGRRVDHLDQGSQAGRVLHHLRKELGGEIQIDASGSARQGGANGAGDTNPNVLCMQDPVSGLAKRLGNGELIHLFVVALLQVNDLALARATDQDHGKAVHRGVGKRRQAVQESWR